MNLVGSDKASDLATIHAEAFDHPWNAAAIGDLLDAPGVFALAERSGFIMIRAVADEAEVLTLAVTPQARRRGLGRRLIEAAAEMAIMNGAQSLFLEVAADNAAAIALYSASGFIAAGRRAGYYSRAAGLGIHALVLKKPLTPPA